MSMVEYKAIKLQQPNSYKIIRSSDFVGDAIRYYRTIKNLSALYKEGRPVSVVSPVRSLTKDELEEYRKFFCKEAKRLQCNMIYFEGPVVVEEYGKDIIG